LAIIDEHLNSKSAEERRYLECELKKMLIILMYIIDADSQVDPLILKSTPTFSKLVPIAYECFEELGW
jgi:hypothetical protein